MSDVETLLLDVIRDTHLRIRVECRSVETDWNALTLELVNCFRSTLVAVGFLVSASSNIETGSVGFLVIVFFNIIDELPMILFSSAYF